MGKRLNLASKMIVGIGQILTQIKETKDETLFILSFGIGASVR